MPKACWWWPVHGGIEASVGMSLLEKKMVFIADGHVSLRGGVCVLKKMVIEAAAMTCVTEEGGMLVLAFVTSGGSVQWQCIAQLNGSDKHGGCGRCDLMASQD
ncbi:hypothetical protein GUJ93_ZPchr0003g18034 [Zizania palustris]|uniref:Uncharacterized protein n=1 Tax=Zizania palustris TaxID=103762 RepID=A0A8J5SJN2_ZIZPA|nr:hypothetical protein GUJ93_ZPchr0003g18034 [Zizania palustris]